jgi:hypothetical protein
MYVASVHQTKSSTPGFIYDSPWNEIYGSLCEALFNRSDTHVLLYLYHCLVLIANSIRLIVSYRAREHTRGRERTKESFK